MFSKRPDKHTTGLINLRNDCFANSSIQAYAALPGLTEYLNSFLNAYYRSIEALQNLNINLDDVIDLNDLAIGKHSRLNTKKSDPVKSVEDLFKIPLHIALAKIVKKLQETQLTSRTVSVWTFLHELERIYDAKISRSQHDAHELTQLINETLEAESITCIKILKAAKESVSEEPGESILHEIDFPEFPFSGLILSQMKCLSCSFVSKPNISPFLMLTLHPPQTLTTDLEHLLDKNESETITDYQCLKCRLEKIVANEAHLQQQGSEPDSNEQQVIQELIELNEDPHLFINEDLPTPIEDYIKEYNKNGLDIKEVTSSVFRESHILKPPKVFGIHLSRSSFNGVTVSRNPCRVSFNDKLTLSIGKEYLDDLQKFQESANSETIPQISSRVLTTDVDDMEDENVQREDVEEKWGDAEDRDHTLSSDTESQTLYGSESGSDSTADSVTQSLGTTVKTGPDNKNETLRSAPISQDQTLSLLKHFRQFKFDEDNVYKYRLRAIIRHQGSHTQGHYECYRKKPLFVKDSEGNIIKLSLEIDEGQIEKLDELGSMIQGAGTKARSESASTNSSSDLQDTIDEDKGTFRRKFSMMMGRRPSVFQADPTEANLQEFIDSGIATPAEVLVDKVDYFHGPEASDLQGRLDKIKEQPSQPKKIKMKKLPSVIKHPYWRVGDSQVSEVSRSAVLFETSSVYMLYYERVDGKRLYGGK